jgi:CheY-like chemotaxis protein
MVKVLIAEDNPVNRELLRELLEARSYDVFEACDGKEALRLSKEIHPDIVLLDIGMPVLDGFSFMRGIRQDASLSGLRVLAVTAYAMHGDREAILSSGFDGYISKPIQADALFEQVDRILNRSKKSSAQGQKLRR